MASKKTAGPAQSEPEFGNPLGRSPELPRPHRKEISRFSFCPCVPLRSTSSSHPQILDKIFWGFLSVAPSPLSISSLAEARTSNQILLHVPQPLQMCSTPSYPLPTRAHPSSSLLTYRSTPAIATLWLTIITRCTRSCAYDFNSSSIWRLGLSPCFRTSILVQTVLF